MDVLIISWLYCDQQNPPGRVKIIANIVNRFFLYSENLTELCYTAIYISALRIRLLAITLKETLTEGNFFPLLNKWYVKRSVCSRTLT